MRIILAHNYYRSSAPSGENQVFEAEHRLLENQKHIVKTFCRNSDELQVEGVLGALKGAASTLWNPFSAHDVRQCVNRFKPNVVHVHNTFPLLSPSIFSAVGNRAARVLTLHNYRLYCPAAIPMRDGRVCTVCLDKRSATSAMRYGCYRSSRLATLPLATSVGLHRRLGTWSHQVDAFIALTEFQRDIMIDAGLPRSLVHVKPNFFPGKPKIIPWVARRPSVVFVGRLSEEKGIKTLVEAWTRWGSSAPELRIVGDGPLRVELENKARLAKDVPIVFLGQISAVSAQEEIAKSQLLVLPSIWFEGFPMVLREAFALGTPAAVSNIGPLPTIVRDGENGVVFSPKNPSSTLMIIRNALETEGLLQSLGVGARQSFERLYTEEVNYDKLRSIYDQAVQVSQQRSFGKRK